MDDRGEKIINLAREMLSSEVEIDPAPAASAKPVISFRMLCLATVLTAVGSSAVTEILTEPHRPLNRYEKTELKALVFYASRQKKLKEDDLQREIEQKFGVGSLDDMTVADFEAARGYLQRKAQ